MDSIQVNFCKNPTCRNFGVPAAPVTLRGRLPKGGISDRYKVIGLDKGVPTLHCKACKEQPPIKSNLGLREERQRLSAYLMPASSPSCPDRGCKNHHLPVGTKRAYRRYGTTHSGSTRYRCNACSKVFAVPGPTTGQKAPEKNVLIFKLLVNKTPFRRLCELADISTGTLYPKLDFLYRQCLAFAGERERELGSLSRERLYVSVDRQDYVVNWSDRADKRNVQLTAVGSADNDSGFVFGMHLNFDGSLNPEEIEREAIRNGDYHLQDPFRRHARLWLKRDYLAPQRRAGARAAKAGLSGDIEDIYTEAVRRADVERSERPSAARRLPASGMQVHSDYTLYAHFLLLHRLFRGTDKVRFFLDQESGIRAACLAAFQERVGADTCDAFYVRINKDMTVDQKRHALRESRAAFKKTQAAHKALSEIEVKLLLIKAQMRAARKLGHWQDRWITHPFPNMSEPEKAVCWLTNRDQYDLDHQAWLYSRASLHGIDKFFMLVRRRLSLLERPIATASAARRTWYGYSAYNPEIVVKLLTIFRVFYNYALPGQDKSTPAMRLRVCERIVSIRDIVDFVPPANLLE